MKKRKRDIKKELGRDEMRGYKRGRKEELRRDRKRDNSK